MKHIIDDTITEPEMRWPRGYVCSVAVIADLFNLTWQEVRESSRYDALVGATIEDVLAFKAKSDVERDKALTELAEIGGCD